MSHRSISSLPPPARRRRERSERRARQRTSKPPGRSAGRRWNLGAGRRRSEPGVAERTSLPDRGIGRRVKLGFGRRRSERRSTGFRPQVWTFLGRAGRHCTNIGRDTHRASHRSFRAAHAHEPEPRICDPSWGCVPPITARSARNLRDPATECGNSPDSAPLHEELDQRRHEDQHQEGDQDQAGSPPHPVPPGGTSVTVLPTRSLWRVAALWRSRARVNSP